MASQMHELPHLTEAERDDLDRILDNEERTQSEDIGNGIIDEYSPMVKQYMGEGAIDDLE